MEKKNILNRCDGTQAKIEMSIFVIHRAGNSTKENSIRGYSRLFGFICVELRALLSSGLTSRVHKVRCCKGEFFESS